jgi:hypothetical protein
VPPYTPGMPTDPYVSPDPDDKPRQQQNLPPGVAYPPAKSWTPTRPGDAPVGRARGPLRGDPGPNIGWAYTLVNRVKDRFKLARGEYVGDAAAVVAEVASRRAASYGRAPVIRDVEVAATVFGYDTTDAFASTRARLVHDAAHDYYRRRALVDSVPDDVLRAAPNDVRTAAAQWRADVPRIVELETTY